MPDTLSLYSSVKNVSGGTRYFSFLPPHGKQLANGACATIFGDIWDKLRTGGRDNERKRVAFEAALLGGFVELMQTPSVYLYDDTSNNIKRLALDNGTLGIADPSWGSYGGAGCV